MNAETFIDKVLPVLGFQLSGNLIHKTVQGAQLSVDIKNKNLIYPEDKGLKINSRDTCNFASNENFVVFECVHRLLEKGYLPRHIELEPKWKLGHGSSGGRADILIRDNQGKPLLIIECKTSGREFSKHWKLTLQDGDQLFSYSHQEPETQFLCLYASDWEDDHIAFQSHVIAIRDNEKYLTDNPRFQAFKDATDQRSRFHIWRETYKLDFTPYGIFEPAIAPYHIGKDKYSIDDLKPISSKVRDGQYHKFATILRQHNVSGRENAFDKLVNLLLCKLVDETENPDELGFYWKGVAYDTHFELLDRLQQLYQRGMKKFLGEEITYIGEKEVNNSLRFIRQNPDATQRAVWNLFIQQKFFTNNDFSLIDVHNETLFYQNAEILLKIIRMWQEFRLIDPENPNQFLGDMFEFFLDQGVKQSEGQFFTPMPVCRFLLQSLPLENMIEKAGSPPRAIDYACGAGHFLNELALQLKPIIEKHLDGSGLEAHEIEQRLADQRSQIFGIEKEYRLSKISKVSAFMYQQPEIQLAYADALVHDIKDHREIKNGSFDILVANPPYSVKGFLETLPDEDRARYSLTETVNDPASANAIETFFIERAAQLLAPGGVAAIILPASIISNGGGTYTRAREILLENFDLVAIAEFGSGTFGKTGTNTTTLFLRRKQINPSPADHFRDRISEWFKGTEASKAKAKTYQDSHLIDAYSRYCEIEPPDYKTLFDGEPSDAFLAHSTFSAYRADFDKLTATVNLKKQRKFKSSAKKEQEAELKKRFLAYISAIEKDKLLHFLLAHTQDNPVLILKSPTDTKERKNFLGYEWSSAKGDEGIKLTTDADGHHITPLYDPTNRHNTNKVAAAIAANFRGELAEIPDSLTAHISLYPLESLLDFSKISFEKQLSLTPRKRIEIKSKWTVESLGKVAVINPSKREIAKIADKTRVSFVEMASVSEEGYILTKVDKSIGDLRKGSFTYFADNDIIIAKITPCMENGKCALAADLTNSVGMGSSEFHVVRCDDAWLLPQYAFAYLNRQSIRSVAITYMTGSSGHRRVPADFLESLPIPLPPLDIQKRIATECEAVDFGVEKARAGIVESRASIDGIVDGVEQSGVPRHTIDSIATQIQYGLSKPMNESGIGYKIFRMNEIEAGRMVDNRSMKRIDITPEEFETYRLNPGDVLFNRTNSIEHVGKTGLYDLQGEHTFASYLVRIVPDTGMIHPLFLTMMMNSDDFQKAAKGSAAKAINQANINATKMRNMQIPVPPLAEQKKLVAKIEKQEAIIAAAEDVISSAPARKAAILEKYL